MSKKQDLTLDDLLTRKRRAEASKMATAIMGKAARRGEAVQIVPVKGAPGKSALRMTRSSTAAAVGHSPPTAPAAASGSGVNRNTSASSGKWRHDLHHKVNPNASRVSKLPTTLSPAVARSLQNNRLFAALHGDQVEVKQAGKGGVSIRGTAAVPPVIPTGPAADKTGFQIRGSAGPAVVQASNFAPGTTAGDIRHAMAQLGKIVSCLILTVAPTVIAEIVFEKKEAGDRCIQQYNGQKADGRVLHVGYKNGPPVGPLVEESRPRDPFAEREEADRKRREQNIHFQDGRFGVKPPPMYSDALMQKGRGFTR